LINVNCLPCSFTYFPFFKSSNMQFHFFGISYRGGILADFIWWIRVRRHLWNHCALALLLYLFLWWLENENTLKQRQYCLGYWLWIRGICDGSFKRWDLSYCWGKISDFNNRYIDIRKDWCFYRSFIGFICHHRSGKNISICVDQRLKSSLHFWKFVLVLTD